MGLEHVGKFEILYSTYINVYNVKVKEKAQPVIGYGVRLIQGKRKPKAAFTEIPHYLVFFLHFLQSYLHL